MIFAGRRLTLPAHTDMRSNGFTENILQRHTLDSVTNNGNPISKFCLVY